jgi:hypothetical protein
MVWAWVVGAASRVQGWMVALAAGMAVVVAAFLAGRRGATDRAAAHAAESERQARERGEDAARAAERDGAAERLRSDRF